MCQFYQHTFWHNKEGRAKEQNAGIVNHNANALKWLKQLLVLKTSIYLWLREFTLVTQYIKPTIKTSCISLMMVYYADGSFLHYYARF